jgi:predicted DNA-binding protein
MRMSPIKDSTLIIRIPLKLKQRIEDLAKEKKISSSELVRKLLEDSIFIHEKEIKEHIMLVNHLSKLVKERETELDADNVEKYNKEIREYKKLLYSHQLEFIKLVSEEIGITNSEIKILKDDLKFMDLMHQGYNNLIHSNKPYDEFYNDFKILDKGKSEDHNQYLEGLSWEKTDRLYSLLLKKYNEYEES